MNPSDGARLYQSRRIMDNMRDEILRRLSKLSLPMDKLFPGLDGKFSEINLEQDLKNFDGDISNPLEFSRWIEQLKEKSGADYLYGGLNENRKEMVNRYPSLKGSKKYIHTGTDIWVPAGTDVASVADGEIENIFIDPLTEGGWGGRVMVKDNDNKHVIYGHLDPKTILVDEGEPVHPGVIIGKVGKSDVNGGHAPHLHYQIMSDSEVAKYGKNLEAIDGYK
jgi:murein DD-endopeptidase MepM/ murein hydrolase activator NlpD